jgi:hypothetical protein
VVNGSEKAQSVDNGGELMGMHVARGCVALAAMALVAVCGANETSSRNDFSLAVNVTDEAKASDAGLPHYPGSKPYRENDQSSSGANIGLATNLFGVKVVAMNLETADRPERVAAFYRRALAKYGKVVECTADAPRNSSPPEDGDDVACDADDPGENKVVYKVGTEDNQRLAAIRTHGSGTRFSLVHVDTRGKKR